jgi:hypothetical protein
MKFLLYILIAYGMSNILVFSSIFRRWRDFWDNVSPNFFGILFSCMICWPFWNGVLGSYLIWSPTIDYGVVTHGVSVFGLFEFPKEVVATFLDGCLTSGTVWLIHTIQETLERHFKINENNTL